jgi:hypothetical protein
MKHYVFVKTQVHHTDSEKPIHPKKKTSLSIIIHFWLPSQNSAYFGILRHQAVQYLGNN